MHDDGRPYPAGPRTTLALRADRLVVAKWRWGPTAPAATRAEARWLATAHHHGVVGLRYVSPETGLIVTDHAGPGSLRTVDPGPAPTAAILVSVATIVGDLHRQGLVHGRLAPEHIVLGGPDRDRPRLCGPHTGVPDRAPDRADDGHGLIRLARFAAGRVTDRRLRRRWDQAADELARDPIEALRLAPARFAALGGRR